MGKRTLQVRVEVDEEAYRMLSTYARFAQKSVEQVIADRYIPVL